MLWRSYLICSTYLICTTDWLECYVLRKQPQCAFQYLWEKGFLSVRLGIKPHTAFLSGNVRKSKGAHLPRCLYLILQSQVFSYSICTFSLEKQYCWLELKIVLQPMILPLSELSVRIKFSIWSTILVQPVFLPLREGSLDSSLSGHWAILIAQGQSNHLNQQL